MHPRAVVVPICLALLVHAAELYAAEGDLDTTFGGSGVVTVPFPAAGQQNAGGLVIQADGAIVVGGGVSPTFSSSVTMALARYDTTGTLDPSFGTGGLVTTAIPGNAMALVMQSDGKLVALGSNGDLVRFTSTGALDPSFGTAGIATAICAGTYFGDLVQTPDGKLVVAVTSIGPGGFNGCVARYLPDGSLDTFGVGGVALVPDWIVSSVAVQADGALVLGGGKKSPAGSHDFAATRLRSDGSVDVAFGANGVASSSSVPPGNYVTAIAVQPDGSIVAVGLTFVLARYHPNGSADRSFGVDGVAVTTFGGFADAYVAAAVALQRDGRIVVGGIGVIDNGPPLGGFENYTVLVRYDLDGTLDASFANGGVQETSAPGEMTRLGLQADGNPVVVASRNGAPLFAGVWTIARHVGFERRCPATPAAGCKTPMVPLAATLKLRDASVNAKDQLQWTWQKGADTTLADFGDPVGGDDYMFCFYDESGPGTMLISSSVVQGGGTCKGKPCWRPKGATGIGYSDSRRVAFGIGSIKLQAGTAGAAKIQVKGQGAGLMPPSPPLGLPLRVQLISQGGVCWESVFSSANTSHNEAERFQGKSD